MPSYLRLSPLSAGQRVFPFGKSCQYDYVLFIMGQTITIRLNKETASWLQETAARASLSQGQIVREQLEKAKRAKANKRFMRLAGIKRGLPRDLSTRKGFSRS